MTSSCWHFSQTWRSFSHFHGRKNSARRHLLRGIRRWAHSSRQGMGTLFSSISCCVAIIGFEDPSFTSSAITRPIALAPTLSVSPFYRSNSSPWRPRCPFLYCQQPPRSNRTLSGFSLGADPQPTRSSWCPMFASKPFFRWAPPKSTGDVYLWLFNGTPHAQQRCKLIWFVNQPSPIQLALNLFI